MTRHFALAGNPNCGKTTLFNLLTGSDCHVGNWPGVTVERREGRIAAMPQAMLVDLPGIYSLRTLSDEEGAALDYLIKEKPDLIINVIDAANLERSLYLTVQLTLLGIPVVAALNMMDVLKKRGDKLDCAVISRLLGVHAVPVSAAAGEGIDELISACELALSEKSSAPDIFSGRFGECEKTVRALAGDCCKPGGIPERLCSFRLMRGDILASELPYVDENTADIIESTVLSIEKDGVDREIAAVSAVYDFTDSVCNAALRRAKAPASTASQRADRVLLDRFLAVPLFLLTVLAVFYLTFGALGTRLGELADSFINGFLADFALRALTSLGASDWVVSLVCRGILAGLGSVCSFLPQIALLFFFLGLLEDCGYMARGAFIADRPLRLIGLGGKAFVPLFMGFGCSVPALMSTRTLNGSREKKICAAVIPFMSCSAKMPVYAMFISAFFPAVRWGAVIMIYALGVACAALGSEILKRFVFKGDEPPFILELPDYRRPSLRSVLRYVRDRLREFLKKAGAVLLPASIIIWALGYFDLSLRPASDAQFSILGRLGGLISFIFKPLGFGDWRCCVAVMSGLIARETTVSTLGILLGSGAADGIRTLVTRAGACSFMTFSLLSVPCVAAVAAMRRELGRVGTAKVLVFEFVTAWTVSFIIYRIALLFL